MRKTLNARANRYYAARPMIYARVMSGETDESVYGSFLSEMRRWDDGTLKECIYEESLRMPVVEIVYELNGKVYRFYFDATRWLMNQIREFGPKEITISLNSTRPTGIAKRRWYYRKREQASKLMVEQMMTMEEALREAGITKPKDGRARIFLKRRGFSQKALIFTELSQYSVMLVDPDGTWYPDIGDILINGIEDIRAKILDAAENELIFMYGNVKILDMRFVAGQPRKVYMAPWFMNLRSTLAILYSWRGISKKRTEMWRDLVLLALCNALATLRRLGKSRRGMGFIFIRVPTQRLHAFAATMVSMYRRCIRQCLNEYFKSKARGGDGCIRFLPFSFFAL